MHTHKHTLSLSLFLRNLLAAWPLLNGLASDRCMLWQKLCCTKAYSSGEITLWHKPRRLLSILRKWTRGQEWKLEWGMENKNILARLGFISFHLFLRMHTPHVSVCVYVCFPPFDASCSFRLLILYRCYLRLLQHPRQCSCRGKWIIAYWCVLVFSAAFRWANIPGCTAVCKCETKHRTPALCHTKHKTYS